MLAAEHDFLAQYSLRPPKSEHHVLIGCVLIDGAILYADLNRFETL